MNFYTRPTINDLGVNLIAISGEGVDKMNFNKIKLEPLNNNNNLSSVSVSSLIKSSKFLEDTTDSYQLHRIENLEKAIQFLQSQHQEVLANLHKEIDVLKQQNRGLQLQVAELGWTDSTKGLDEEIITQRPLGPINPTENSLLKSKIIALEKALKEETSKNKEFLANLRKKNISSEFMDDSVNKTKYIEVGRESEMLDLRASFPPPVIKDHRVKQKELKLTSAETYVGNSNRQHQKDLESVKFSKVYNTVKSNNAPNISKDSSDQPQMLYDRASSRNSISLDKPILKLPPIYSQPKNQERNKPSKDEAASVKKSKRRTSWQADK